ncbi:hypothetical protein, partial [Roseicella aerolata]
PLVRARRTASSSNSFVNRRCCFMWVLLHHRDLSTFPKQVQRLAARKMAVMRFASSIGISPGIVVGQMQHRKLLGPDSLNFLKRRYAWDDIGAALA